MTGTHFQVLEADFQKIHSAVEVLNQSAAKVRTIWVFGEFPGWGISVGAVFCLSFALLCSAWEWRRPQISLCTNIVKQTFHPLHVSVWIPSPWYQDGGRNRWISYNKEQNICVSRYNWPLIWTHTVWRVTFANLRFHWGFLPVWSAL